MKIASPDVTQAWTTCMMSQSNTLFLESTSWNYPDLSLTVHWTGGTASLTEVTIAKSNLVTENEIPNQLSHGQFGLLVRVLDQNRPATFIINAKSPSGLVSASFVIPPKLPVLPVPPGALVSNKREREVKIIAQHSQLVLDVEGGSSANGARIIQFPYHGGNNQRWKMTESDDGTVTFISKHSNKALDVEGASHEQSAKLIQWDHHGGANQRFSLRRHDDTSFSIHAVHSLQVLDVEGASRESLARIIQYPFHGNGNQRFLIVDL